VVNPAASILSHGFTRTQAPFTVLMTQATGTALVQETVFEGRLFYIDLLNRMGANITLCDPHRALVSGPTPLRGKFVESPDVRAGLAMVVAGMVASGTTTIGNAYQIDRGYQSLEQRLSQVGATISRPADLR
jgi:UDP-N-acetylglucosamine 1-carboxyvinyltransferase